MRPLHALIPGFVLLFTAPLFAGPDDPVVPLGDSSELVRKLADPSFRIRETAERELIRRGAGALLEVQRGADDADLEIRRRCRGILREIQQSDVDRLLVPFMAGTDDPKTPLPGWAAVRGVMGADAASRYLYAILYKSDRPLLEAMEKDPRSAAGQLESRVQNLLPRFGFNVRVVNGAKAKNDPPQITTEAVAAVLLIALVSPPDNNNTTAARVIGLLNQPAIQQTICWSNATRRLTEKWLERRCDDAVLGLQIANLATTYGCSELIEAKIRPATVRFVDAAAANPADANKVYQAINLARQFNMNDLLDQKLKPAIRKSIEAAAREPVDLNRLQQLVNISQSLGGIDNDLRQVLRPALTGIVKKHAGNVGDVAQFYAVVNLVRVSQCNDLIEEYLQPAYRATLLKLASQSKDLNALRQAFFHAQTLGMQEDIESILKPAVEAQIRTIVAQTKDANRLQEAFGIAQQFQLKESMQPIAKQLIDDIATTKPDVARINTIIHFARAAQLPDVEAVIEKKLKPVAREALIAAKDQPLNIATISQTLALADQLQLKDGVDLALKAAETKTLPGYVRSQAIFHVAKNAKLEAVPQLEKLLTDGTDLGAFNTPGAQIRAQIADVALGALIQLTGQKIADYDFPGLRLIGGNGVMQSPVFYGVESDAARQANQKKWRESQAKS